jgi:hypothetical protein
MASSTDISNRALQIIGAAAITNLNDGSKNGRECVRCYDSLRLALLESYKWNFATRFTSLANITALIDPPSAATTLNRYFAYELPSDFIKIVAVNPQGTTWLYDTLNYVQDQDYFIQEGVLWTWIGPNIPIKYVYDFFNVNSMSPLFREALAALMAVNMAEVLTQSNTKKAAAKAQFDDAIAEAKRSNAIAKPSPPMHIDSFLQVRV